MTVGIVTDSSCSLDTELVAKWGIVVVPMQIVIGGESYSEDRLTPEEVLDRSGEGFSSAAPSPASFSAAVSSADSGDGVVIITVASKLSSTFQAAVIATASSKAKTHVVDSTTAAGAQGLVVLAAAEEASKGSDIRAVIRRAEHVSKRVRLVAAVGNLEHIARSGRVPGSAARAARYVGIKTLFELQEGRARPLRPALSSQGAINAIIARLHRERAELAQPHKWVLHLCGLHATDSGAAQHLIARASEGEAINTLFVGSFGAVMIGHTGPEVFGLAWWREPRTFSELTEL